MSRGQMEAVMRLVEPHACRAPGWAPPPCPTCPAVSLGLFVSLCLCLLFSFSLSLKLNGIQLLAPCVFCSWLSPFHYD